MNVYKACVKQISEKKFKSKIEINGKTMLSGTDYRTQDEARRDANLLLIKVEQGNGDWDGNHSTATYHYLQYGNS